MRQQECTCMSMACAILGHVGATLQPFATWNVLSAPLLIGPNHLGGFSEKETCFVWAVFLGQIVTSTITGPFIRYTHPSVV